MALAVQYFSQWSVLRPHRLRVLSLSLLIPLKATVVRLFSVSKAIA